MSRFTHSICETCWAARQPDRTPHRLVDEYRETEPCCFCGAEHRSGIYYRLDPAEAACGGRGRAHEASS